MGKKALKGVKVVDFSWVATGPVALKYLATHGATVIHIESTMAPDISRFTSPIKDLYSGSWDQSGYFADCNVNKYGITLNLNHPKAEEIIKRLVCWGDILAESFRPGIVSRWGLDYKSVSSINPSIIMISLSLQGQNGPFSQLGALGFHLGAACGLGDLLGSPDQEAVLPFGPFTDYIASRLGAVAILAALLARRRTNKGQYIDLSQLECAVQFLLPAMVEYSITQQLPAKMGNRHPYAAPHGAYPCREDNRWCVIAVFSDREWQSFCKVVNGKWTKEARFSTAPLRKENEDELDALIAQWTRQFTGEQLMTILQTEGVAAAPVYTIEELFGDTQLKHRNNFRFLEHPVIGSHPCNGVGFSLSKTPAEFTRSAPCLGEHNEYVYTEILGFSDSEFINLLNEGVL